MSWHIIRALCRVGKEWISVRRYALHEGFHIPEDVRICIFTQHQRCAGVFDKYVAQAGANSRITDYGLNLTTDVKRTATGRLDSELLLADHSAGTGDGT